MKWTLYNKELSKELIQDKTGIIDVRAKTSKGENIDITGLDIQQIIKLRK